MTSTKQTWTQPLCDACWARRHPGHEPVRVRDEFGEQERCCLCGAMHRSGIYDRIDPRSVPYPRVIHSETNP